MATRVVAQESVCALRREIARIEGRLEQTLSAPTADPVTPQAQTVLRRAGRVAGGQVLFETGAAEFDAALGGGLPAAGLLEIHSLETRDAGAASGFVLALLSRFGIAEEAPVLWIATGEILREAGLPYAVGLRSAFGLQPANLLMSRVRHLSDALWVAEEAAQLTAISAVILEFRGNPQKLDLTATRRLHRRAADTGKPVFMLRQGAAAEPTAAPVRLVVSPAKAGLRETFGGPLPRSIGPPAFTIQLSKNRNALPGQFTLEWNPDERAFHQRRPSRDAAYPGVVVPVSGDRTHPPAAAGTVVAFAGGGEQDAAPGDQPPRPQHAARRSA